jgi:hypothetical protein
VPDPRTRRSPGGTSPGSIQTTHGSERIAHHDTRRLARWSPTAAYVEGREAVLGHALHLHREPEVAASLLAEVMGPASARAWASRLLAELDGGA